MTFETIIAQLGVVIAELRQRIGMQADRVKELEVENMQLREQSVTQTPVDDDDASSS